MSTTPFRLQDLLQSYVGTNPEVGGSSPFQLTKAHHRTQILSPAGAITVKLPTTDILTGDTWNFKNNTNNQITIQSSDGTTLVVLGQGSVSFVSLQNTPTGTSHWKNLVSLFYQEDDTTMAAVTFAGNLGGSASSPIAIRVTRVGRVVTMSLPGKGDIVPTTNSSSLNASVALPVWARPPANLRFYSSIINNGATVSTTLGLIFIATTGTIYVYRDEANTAFTNSANAGWNGVQNLTWTV